MHQPNIHFPRTDRPIYCSLITVLAQMHRKAQTKTRVENILFFHLTLRNFQFVTEERNIQFKKFKNDLKEQDWGFEMMCKTFL